MTLQATNIFETQIKTILQRLKIISQHSFLMDETLIEVHPQFVHQHTSYNLGDFGFNTFANLKEERKKMVQSITNQIYSKCYCHNNAKQVQLPSTSERSAFMDTLSAANTSLNTYDLCWKIYAVQSNGQAFAQKKGVLRPLLPNTYVYANVQQTQPAIHQYVHFYRQKENRKAQAIFYYVYGNEYLSHEDAITRIYWHIKPEGAATLVALLCYWLNAYEIPFNFKCLNHKDLYTRSDSAVLYINQQHLAIVQMILPIINKKMQPYLEETIPLFTKALFKGIAFAEDPGNGQSFGMSRVAVIAEALVEAFQQNITEQEALLNFVLSYMESMGISRTQMHLNPRLQTI